MIEIRYFMAFPTVKYTILNAKGQPYVDPF